MRKLMLILFIWTSFYFYLPSVAVADEHDVPNPPEPRIQQQMQRIRRAQNELQEQREQLERERREWEFDRERQEMEQQRGNMQRQGRRPWFARKQMHRGGHKPLCRLLMVMCLVVHVLAAIWVFQDIRTRGQGSGIWIVIALLAGLLGALVYAVVRLGDVITPMQPDS